MRWTMGAKADANSRVESQTNAMRLTDGDTILLHGPTLPLRPGAGQPPSQPPGTPWQGATPGCRHRARCSPHLSDGHCPFSWGDPQPRWCGWYGREPLISGCWPRAHRQSRSRPCGSLGQLSELQLSHGWEWPGPTHRYPQTQASAGTDLLGWISGCVLTRGLGCCIPMPMVGKLRKEEVRGSSRLAAPPEMQMPCYCRPTMSHHLLNIPWPWAKPLGTTGFRLASEELSLGCSMPTSHS